MLIAAFISSALGILIEFIQRWMAMGRGFDPGDMVADVARCSDMRLSLEPSSAALVVDFYIPRY